MHVQQLRRVSTHCRDRRGHFEPAHRGRTPSAQHHERRQSPHCTHSTERYSNPRSSQRPPHSACSIAATRRAAAVSWSRPERVQAATARGAHVSETLCMDVAQRDMDDSRDIIAHRRQTGPLRTRRRCSREPTPHAQRPTYILRAVHESESFAHTCLSALVSLLFS